jgi:hypothetical protein
MKDVSKKITGSKTNKQSAAHRVREATAEYGASRGEIVLYRAPDGTVSLDVRLERETLWLDAHQMAILFGRDRSVILRHIRNIYETNELDRVSTYAKNAQVAADGKNNRVENFNLGAQPEDVLMS